MGFFRRRPGINLIEVLVAAVIAGIVMLALGNFIGASLRFSNSDRDQGFAMQKALQMMEELAAYKAGANDKGLDKFADGLQFTLTTVPNTSPGHVLSGNPKIQDSYYKYVREILVVGVPGDDYARKVTVRVWYADPAYQTGGTTQAAAKGKPLAVVSNVLRSNVAKPGPVHVLDVYAISIENMPHVMRKDNNDQYYPSASDARRNFEASLKTITTMSPWLSFRVHYISRLSIGRDPHYRPAINAGMTIAKDPDSSKRDPLNDVYFYPGLIGQSETSYYYDPGIIRGKHRLGDATGTYTNVNGDGYALADQFNHAVRHPLEFDASNQPLKPDGVTVATRPEDMSLRQFLEDLLADTSGKYRNAIVVNLHGELFPCLPLRNYADPAKDPGDASLMDRRRLVTHPYKLNFDTTESIKLLVYPFMDDGSNTPSTTYDGTNDQYVYINGPTDLPAIGNYAKRAQIVIKDLKPYLLDDDLSGSITPADVKVHVIQRERQNMGNARTKYVRLTVWPPSTPSKEPRSGATARHTGPHVTSDHGGGANPVFGGASGNDLIIDVRDLDYDARKTDDNGSLYGIDSSSADYLLHRLQYFPDPYLPFLDEASGGTTPRNTARMIIEYKLNTTALPVDGKRFEVLTQLRRSNNTFEPETSTYPSNSKTWFYVGKAWSSTQSLYWDTLAKKPTIPWTEQLQLVGDPRHNPYHDIREKGLYNPYFSEFYADREIYKDVRNKSGDLPSYLQYKNPYAVGLTPVTGTLDRYDIKLADTKKSWAGIKYNAPAYFRLWREALLRHNMVFANLSGEPIRFLGLGGEFALEKKVNGVGDLKAASQPYDGGTGDAGDKSNELLGTSGRAPYIERQSDLWYAKPWLGELYTSNRWTVWSTTGNLSASEFRREKLSAIDNWSYNTNKEDSHSNKRIDNNYGLPSFLNGEQAIGSSGPFDVDEGSDKGTQTATGRKIADGLRVKLLSQPKTKYAYKLTAGATPPEWAVEPYQSLRTLIDWLNVDPPVNPRGYYAHNQGSSYFASNPLLLSDNTATDPRRAFVTASTLRPESATQVPPILDIGTTAMVGTYFDGTHNGIGKYNIKPLPRVKLTSPANGDGIASTLSMTWYARWTRSDGKEYSPFYTYDPADLVGGPLDVVHFVKLKPSGGTWAMAGTGTATEAGVPGPAGEAISNQAYPNPITASFNVGSLTNGEYRLRVEAYRKEGSTILPGNYAYHEIVISISN